MIVMYHHINDHSLQQYGFGHLPLKNFVKQLKWITQQNQANNSDCSNPPNIKLTFDDGLSSHFDLVAPVLAENRLHAKFFVQTMPLIEELACNVHLCQHLISKIPPDVILSEISKLESAKPSLHKISSTYELQDSSVSKKIIKTFFNYSLNRQEARDILIFLLNQEEAFDEKNFINRVYLNKNQLVKLKQLGFSVLPHFHSHALLTNLSAGELRAEFDYSIEFFQNLFDERITEICIPFGGQNSWNNACHQIALSKSLETVFTVNDIRSICDLNENGIAYEARVDCNQLPFSAYREYN